MREGKRWKSLLNRLLREEAKREDIRISNNPNALLKRMVFTRLWK